MCHNRCYIFSARRMHRFGILVQPLIKGTIGVIVNIDKITCNIVPMDMELIDNILFHGMFQNVGT